MTNQKEYALISTMAVAIFMLLVAAAILFLFFVPSSSYAVQPSVCWDCVDYGYGEMCGMDYHGTTGCRQTNGRCELTGVACNIWN